MNASQLWDTTMNPETRALIQVKIDDFSSSDKRISVLMGDDVIPVDNGLNQMSILKLVMTLTSKKEGYMSKLKQ